MDTPNQDMRALSDGLMQQYSREDKQRINVNIGEQPSRSSRGHLFGSTPRGFAPDTDDQSPDYPSAPQPDMPITGYGNDDAAICPAPGEHIMGYGNDDAAVCLPRGERLPTLGTYNPLQSRHVASPPSDSQNIGNDPNSRVVHAVQESKAQKSGLGGAGMLAAGAGAGLLGGLLVADGIDDSIDGFDQGFDDSTNDFGGGDF